MESRIAMNFTRYVILSILVMSTAVVGQDSHYWMDAYGTRANLLGGVVAGSVDGMSSTFYNPGALYLATARGLLVTADAFELSTISLKDGAGIGKDLSSTRFRKPPGIVAGLLYTDTVRSHKIAFSILTRYDFDLTLDGRTTDPRDALPDIGGDENYSGEVIFTHKVYESWGGLTWSYELNEQLGIGVSGFGALRSQEARFQVAAQTVAADSTGAAVWLQDNLKYWNLRLLAKLGISYNTDKFTCGIALTTPSLNAFGDGRTGVTGSATNIDFDSSGTRESVLSSDFQDGLASEFRSPISVAGGGSVRFGQTIIHAAVEWFDDVPAYDVLEVESFYEKIFELEVTHNVLHESQSVVNYGIGIQHIMNPHFAWYGSIARDHSSRIPGSETRLLATNWDLWHITAGSSFSISSVDLTLGLGYSRGTSQSPPLVDFAAAIREQLESAPVEREVAYRRLKLMIGFSLTL
jgi:hypothetical protein